MATQSRWTNHTLEYYESITGEVIWRSVPVHKHDDFFGGIGGSATGFIADTPGNGDSVTYYPVTGIIGAAQMETGSDIDDTVFIKTIDLMYAKYSPSIQCRIYPVAMATSAFGLGFAVVNGIVNAGPLKQVGTNWTTTGADVVGLHYDASATTGTFYGMASKSSVDKTAVNTTIAPVNDTFNVLRVDLNYTGTQVNAYMYIDGVLKATILDAVDKDAVIAGYIAVSTRAAAKKTAIVDVVDAWSNRS